MLLLRIISLCSKCPFPRPNEIRNSSTEKIVTLIYSDYLVYRFFSVPSQRNYDDVKNLVLKVLWLNIPRDFYCMKHNRLRATRTNFNKKQIGYSAENLALLLRENIQRAEDVALALEMCLGCG